MGHCSHGLRAGRTLPAAAAAALILGLLASSAAARDETPVPPGRKLWAELARVESLDVPLYAVPGMRLNAVAKPWLGYRLAQALLRIAAGRLRALFARLQNEL